MMDEIPADFFPPLQPPPSEQRRGHRAPIWMQPRPDELAALVPVRRVLGRSERVAVVLSHVDVYRDGCHFLLHTVARCLPEDSDEECGDLHDRVFGHRVRRGGGVPPGPLRVGVRFADGSKVLSSLPFHRPTPNDEPEGPHLHLGGGGGGGSPGFVEQSSWAWLWPLPPAAPLDLVMVWEDMGIPPSVSRLDGAAIVTAAARARPLWHG